jgi:hypothetical protein
MEHADGPWYVKAVIQISEDHSKSVILRTVDRDGSGAATHLQQIWGGLGEIAAACRQWRP